MSISIIIGAGITGLYLANKLIDKNANEKIIIIEKRNRIGGRVLSCNKDNMKFSSGAGRFSKNHKYLFKLINDLGLQDKIRPVSKRRHYYIDGKYFKNESKLLKHYKITKFKSISDIWKYIFIYEHDNKLMKELNIVAYLNTFLDKNIVDLIVQYYGFHSEMYNYNAYNAIKAFEYDFDIVNEDFYYLSGGLSQITELLYKKLKEHNNVKFIMNNELKDINDKNKKITLITGKKINYKRLYLTIKKDDFINIPYFKKYNEIFDSVYETTLLRIHAKYPTNWFKNLPVVKTDTPIMCIIPIFKKKGLIQISYTDSYYSDFWNELHKQNKVNKYLKMFLNKMYPNKNIPEPDWISFNYWKNSVHLWKPSFDSSKIIKKIKDTFENKEIFILSEAYAERQGWIDGTLELVNRL